MRSTWLLGIVVRADGAVHFLEAVAASQCDRFDCDAAAHERSRVERRPARAYIEQLLPDVPDGTIRPGRVFEPAIRLDEVPDGYRAMASREALKMLIKP